MNKRKKELKYVKEKLELEVEIENESESNKIINNIYWFLSYYEFYFFNILLLIINIYREVLF